MAVPNTTTFALSDVIAEIAGVQNSLQDCFDDADAAGFDPSFEGSKDRLSNFRNYNTPCNSTTSLNFYPSSGQASSGSGTCPIGGAEVPFYFIGAGVNVANGDTVTSDAGGCNTFNGGNLWYRVRSNTSGFLSVRVSSVGVASGIISCT